MTSFLDYEGLKEYDNNNKNYINEKIPTLVAGDNITLTTDTDTNEITISSTGGGSGSSDASGINYDNTTSGLSATEVQSAIDELNSDLALIDSRAEVTDLIAEADKGKSARRIVLTGSGTLNTPYTEGLTGYCSAGVAYINMISPNYGEILYCVSGNNQIFTKYKNGDTWGNWDKITLNSDLASYSKLTYSSTEPTNNLSTNMIWIG